ncbi:uncharacterized protein BJ212DRAFT_1219925, partial [Suillus subaureus]
GYSHVNPHLGQSQWTIPPFADHVTSSTKYDFHTEFDAQIKLLCPSPTDILDAHDALLTSKVGGTEPDFDVGDFVYLATTHRRYEYL